MKKLAIIGSTGSIGTQTLEVIDQMSDVEVSSLACGRNIKLLLEQARKYMPHLISCAGKEDADILKEDLKDLPIEVLWGDEGLNAVAEDSAADMVLNAIVGMKGIIPTIKAIEKKKTIALANKETLVAAGHIIMPLAKKNGVKILPVDSEHSAIFQSLRGNESENIKRILLTASGGPFRGKTYEELEQVTLEDALKNPNWSMGRKVTIDSASMVNKGLEVMEAHWLFGVPVNRIQVLVHPESILHSAVEYDDGAVIGQMGVPDMKIPIHYALTYPNRGELTVKPLDLFEVQTLHFYHPDMETFFGLQLAFDASLAGGNMPCVFNAANEEADAAFFNKKIRFVQIPQIIQKAMEEADFEEDPSVEDILETERDVREIVRKLICTL
ncbi:MAG: 1-deoxy-D-xylulose-5-phosphate reductoisomerase [Lachnospiraceae bacterium]|uniref:1-deoxy-D-xylulose 5-phosphate reductoisomerase n=1 Tax=Candidatus Weimeria bifida TaxID=2599074 RepID=A0A6N7J030_9FIRM|nr:1-deoxy-D-xylulose-5-phosphate reductoisomerase [Candidatus Weimeria bifida]RRF96297.1 MAG: 1-deoxy-D-xylulose-5-phosphate reductoisomerase [Lachnospiraceae bacterium]